MSRIIVDIPPDLYADLRGHLLRPDRDAEEAAFLFAAYERVSGEHVFRAVEWYPVPPEGFASRSAFHFELTDATQASVIKRAHDLGTSLVEVHSHHGDHEPCFSPSDLLGFEEFVPHVWWRLKGKPYLAIVVAESGFDGFVWLTDPGELERLHGITVGEELLTPSHRSPLRPGFYVE